MAPSARSARAELLRDVLSVAVEVGRRRQADGTAPVPAPLRPLLSLRKLTPRALAAAERAGDDDDFRGEVRAAVDHGSLGEAGRLWLDRPAGWSETLDAMVRARETQLDQADARRALEREERVRARVEAARDEALAEAARMRDELARLQDAHDALLAEARAAAERAEAAAAERTRAVRELKGMEARHAQAHEDLREVRAARDAAVAAAAQATERAARAVDARTAGTAPSSPSADAPPDEVHADAAGGADDAGGADGPEPIDRRAAAEAIQGAAAAAAALATSLTDLAGALGSDGEAGEARPAAAAGPTRRGPRRTARPAPRRPVGRLPGGLHDDTPEAADHLVRLPGCALLVDGYNATMATWPGRSLPEQRERLVAALDELEARVGVESTVVFDGVEARWSRSASRRVHVHFTPTGIEADDVILGLVDIIADDRPVVVASDDRRVQDGARRRGAHVIGIDQLRALVG